MNTHTEAFTAMELYAVSATRFLIALRNVRGKDVHEYMRTTGGYTSGNLSGLFSNLLNLSKNWSLAHLAAVYSYFSLEPDEFFRVGRVIHRGLPEYPSGEELAGTKPGSFERFRRLYDRASLGAWVPQVHPAEKAAAWSPDAYASYQKGKLGDAEMYAALCDMVARLVESPGMTADEIRARFGLLRG